MKICFIVNPNAGSGRGLKLWNRARSYMDKRGLEFEIAFTASEGDAADIAGRISEAADTEDGLAIFVIGSDGTLSEVINGLRHPERVSIGYIPVCIRYGCARSLRLSCSPKAIIRSFNSTAGSRIEAMDYGVLTCGNGETVRRFVNSAGIGFDAAVFSRMERCRGEQLSVTDNTTGRLLLYRELFRELIFGKPAKGYIELDGSRRIEFNNLMFVSVHIHPYEYAFRFGNYADPKDGMLEICAVSSRSKLTMLSMIIKSRLGILRPTGRIRLLQCREAHIHFDRESAVHADGEALDSMTDIDLHCVSQQLHMIRR